jgi:NADH-quinone oxidoreductase subunit A
MAGAPYTIIVVFTLLGFVFLAATLIISRLLRPNRPHHEKLTTYECGIEPVGQSWGQFHVHYYIFALLFVLFDVETVYLFPWALKLGQLRMFAFMEMLVFLGILAVGLIYAWRKGVLEWIE